MGELEITASHKENEKLIADASRASATGEQRSRRRDKSVVKTLCNHKKWRGVEEKKKKKWESVIQCEICHESWVCKVKPVVTPGVALTASPHEHQYDSEALLSSRVLRCVVQGCTEHARILECTEDKSVDIDPRPCTHNDWDDVRTRNGSKVLRCRVCQAKWKLPSGTVPRCMSFLHDCCTKAPSDCPLLHVRRKKRSIQERYEAFGDTVLVGVSRDIVVRRAASASPAAASDTDSSISAETAAGVMPAEGSATDALPPVLPPPRAPSPPVFNPATPAEGALNPYLEAFAPKGVATSGCGWITSMDWEAPTSN